MSAFDEVSGVLILGVSETQVTVTQVGVADDSQERDLQHDDGGDDHRGAGWSRSSSTANDEDGHDHGSRYNADHRNGDDHDAGRNGVTVTTTTTTGSRCR